MLKAVPVAFSLEKSTPAWKKYANAVTGVTDYYQICLHTQKPTSWQRFPVIHIRHCDNDSDCQANLKCGYGNCNTTALGFLSKMDCCYAGNLVIISFNKTAIACKINQLIPDIIWISKILFYEYVRNINYLWLFIFWRADWKKSRLTAFAMWAKNLWF